MLSNASKTLGILLLAASAFACVEEEIELPRVYKSVLPGITTLGVCTFTGEGGQDIADLLHYELQGRRGFTLLDPQDVFDIDPLRLHRFDRHATVLIGGKVAQDSYRVVTTQVTNISPGADAALVTHQRGIAEVTVLVEGRTVSGDLVFSRRIAVEVRGAEQVAVQSGTGSNNDETSLRTFAFEKVADALAYALAGGDQRVVTKLYLAHRGHGEAEAIAAAQAGDLEAALRFFRDAEAKLHWYKTAISVRSRARMNVVRLLALNGQHEEALNHLKSWMLRGEGEDLKQQIYQWQREDFKRLTERNIYLTASKS